MTSGSCACVRPHACAVADTFNTSDDKFNDTSTYRQFLITGKLLSACLVTRLSCAVCVCCAGGVALLCRICLMVMAYKSRKNFGRGQRIANRALLSHCGLHGFASRCVQVSRTVFMGEARRTL